MPDDRMRMLLPPAVVAVALPALGIAIAYFAAASASMAEFGVNTPIWFANALAVAWLLQIPPRAWPWVIAPVYLADAVAIQMFGSGPSPLLAIADSIEIFAAAALLHRCGGAAAALTTVGGLARMILVCVSVPVISATWGALVLSETFDAPFADGFATWYGASALGLLVICPILLIWFTRSLREPITANELSTMAAMLGGLGLIAVIVSGSGNPAYLFVIFPALLMLVWRGGLLGASLGASLLVVIGLWRTFSGDGAMASLAFPSTTIQSQVETVQIFLGALVLSSLPLAVVLADQRRLALELTRVADARGEFLAAMSHEIRTPMTGVLGMVDLLEAEQPSERQKMFLKSIRSSGRHLMSVINDVLDFSRIETGRIELEHIDFSLPVLLEEVQGLLQPLATERGIKLAVGLGERSPPVVKGDPTRLTQILLNLAGNAIKFTPEGSVLILAMHRPEAPGHRFRFEVRDTGIGISDAVLPHIFTAFAQADRSTSRIYGGSGLGLAISKRLVDAMGGEIGVTSRLGEGSLFWFDVPLSPGNAINLPVTAAHDAAPVQPRRILLAEDVEINRDLIRTVLERNGHHVTIVCDGRGAVEVALSEAFDLILMDVHMPVMDGLDATRAIRAGGGRNASVPIVALTANVMASEQAKCRAAGMDAVLMKPIDWGQVRGTIAKFTGGNGAIDAGPRDVGAAPFDEAAFGELTEVISAERLEAHLDTLGSEVRGLCDADGGHDPLIIAGVAHRIVSQSGMFGLMRLSACAEAIEQAALAGEPIAPALDSFRAAAGDVELYLTPRVKALQG